MSNGNGGSGAPASQTFSAQSEALFKALNQGKWLFGALGALCVIFHFARSGFMPEITLQDLGLVAAATAAFTLLTGAYFSLFLLFPALYIISLMGSTTRLALAIIPLSWLLAAGIWISILELTVGIQSPLLSWSAFLLTTAVLVVALLRLARICRCIQAHRDVVDVTLKLTALYAALFPLAHLILLGSSSSQDLDGTTLLFLFCAVPFIHILVVLTDGTPLAPRAFVILVLTAATLFGTGQVGLWLDRAVQLFGIGMLDHQKVIVTEKGCDIAKAADVVDSCATLSSSNLELRTLGPVVILTRLGSHVVLARTDWKFGTGATSVPLPAAEVVSWFPWNDKGSAPTTAPKAPAPEHKGPVADPTVPAKLKGRPQSARRATAVTCAPDSARSPTMPETPERLQAASSASPATDASEEGAPPVDVAPTTDSP